MRKKKGVLNNQAFLCPILNAETKILILLQWWWAGLADGNPCHPWFKKISCILLIHEYVLRQYFISCLFWVYVVRGPSVQELSIYNSEIEAENESSITNKPACLLHNLFIYLFVNYISTVNPVSQTNFNSNYPLSLSLFFVLFARSQWLNKTWRLDKKHTAHKTLSIWNYNYKSCPIYRFRS